MKYDIILMDADDTILDFRRSELGALEQTLLHYGAPFSEQIKEQYRTINEGLWRSFERQEISKEQLLATRFKMLFDVLKIDCNPLEVNKYYLDMLAEGAYLIDGAMELCKALSQKAKLYIVTNGVTMTQKRRLAKSGIDKYFSHVFVSEEMGVQKPRREYFDKVFDKIGAPRTRAIILGDSLTSDMPGGTNAGIARCWFCPDSAIQADSSLFDYRIERLADFLEIVEGEQ